MKPTGSLGPFRPAPPPATLGVVSVAGRIDATLHAGGCRALEARGYRLKHFSQADQGSPSVSPYLAAEDAVRARALTEAFLDPEVDAVIAARGGYGAMRILPLIDWASVAGTGKALIGFSDITALHLSLQHHGLQSIHGPTVQSLGRESAGAGNLERLVAALSNPGEGHLAGGAAWGRGCASGVLRGGNLSLLAACAPLMKDVFPHPTVLLVEDVKEPLYRLDRLLWTLSGMKALEGVVGYALGSFEGCGEDYRDGPTPPELVVNLLADRGCPIVRDLPIGHGLENAAVPLGAWVTVDAESGALSWQAHDHAGP